MTLDLESLLERREQLQASLSDAIMTRNEMEGRMQSRYDTQKEEWALQCEILERQLQQIEKLIASLTQLQPSEGADRVAIGSMVRLSIDGDPPEMFVILDESGGYEIKGVTSMSTKSPVGQAVLGAEPGGVVTAKVGGGLVSIEVMSIEHGA